jgi:hypothetical protein
MLEHLLPTTQIDNNPLPPSVTSLQKVTHSNIDDMHSKEIASVDKRRSPLKLLDEVTEEVRLVGIIQLFHAPFGYYTAIVCLRDMLFKRLISVWDFDKLTPMTWSSCARPFADLRGFFKPPASLFLKLSAIIQNSDYGLGTICDRGRK